MLIVRTQKNRNNHVKTIYFHQNTICTGSPHFPRFYNPMITNSLHNLINFKKQSISILRIKKGAQNRQKSKKINPKNEKIVQNRNKNDLKTTFFSSPKTRNSQVISNTVPPATESKNVLTAPPDGSPSIRDGQNLIYRDRGNVFLRPVGPSDFDCIHALRLAKPEIQPVVPL
jgi:hypothetical protein